VPEQIPRERWIKTTIRIQHLSSMNQERRAARYRKYLEADPGNRFQPSYRQLLDPPRYRKPWIPRAPDEPVVKETTRHRRLALQIAHRASRPVGAEAAPTLSAIVIAQNDRAKIEAALEALLRQEVSEPFEVILVDSGKDGTAELVRERFPDVRVVHLPEPALPGRARNAGLKVARGRYVSFPGSHVVVTPGALQHRVDAHDAGAVMVTGSVLNGTPTLSGWASYFLDHSEALPSRPSSPLEGAPSHCSYLTEPLVEIGGFPEDRRVGEDTVVNRELFRRGHSAARASRIRFVHKSPCRTPVRLARHHFQRGRGFGRILWEGSEESRRLPARLRNVAWLATRYPFRRLRLVHRNVARWGGPLRTPYRASLPLLMLGIASAALGAISFLARPGPALFAPIERSRRRAAEGEGAPVSSGVGTPVPTVFYVVPFAERDAMRPYVERWGGTPGSRMEFVFVEDLLHTKELASGTYVFAGVERLAPPERALLRGVAWDLDKAAGRARLLNDPREVHAHGELLTRLHQAASRLDMRVEIDPGRACSALRIGDGLLPYVLEDGNLAFLEDCSHDAPLRALCEVAGLGFARIDYRVEDGRIAVDDVTTNPAIAEMYARITLAFESVDTVPDALAPVPLVTDAELV
jgi:glycosyltransferase involved in cell wall biosynthesis